LFQLYIRGKLVRFVKFFVILQVLAMIGCQSLNSILEEPKLSFNSVEIAGINLDGVDLIANVGVENPYAFAIPLPNIDWEFFINSASFTQGTVKDNKSIGSRGKTTMALPLSVSYDGLFKTFETLVKSSISGSAETPYDIAMGITFPIPLLESKVYNLNFSGALPIPQLPKLSLGQINISKVDLSGVELACGINVVNPNIFPIPFPKINWDYEVNGTSVAKSSFSGAGDIAAGVTRKENIIVKASYMDVLRAALSVRNTGEVKTNLLLDTGLSIPALDGLKNSLNVPVTLPLL
jgi:LEA14-like dessication related protein